MSWRIRRPSLTKILDQAREKQCGLKIGFASNVMGMLDLAFCIGPFPSPAIKGRLLVTESLYGLVNREHPMAGYEVLEIRDMKDCPVIAADSKNKGYPFFRSIGGAFSVFPTG